MKNYEVMLYSISQECFHHETLADYIAKNREDVILGKINDYKLIAIAETYEQLKLYQEDFMNIAGIERNWC